MALQSVPKTDPRTADPHELNVCLGRKWIRELWPDEFDTKPVLTLIHGGKECAP